jgi:hypothetical protein
MIGEFHSAASPRISMVAFELDSGTWKSGTSWRSEALPMRLLSGESVGFLPATPLKGPEKYGTQYE